MSKKVLLVGINKYQLPGNNLNGCINDINAIHNELITHYGYQPEQIKMLSDGQATKQGILEALEWLVVDSEEATFHYSGHGTQFEDQNGQDIQALCPHDIQDENTVITDKQLHDIFHKIPLSSKLYFIADCCHSGTIDRDLSLPINTLHRTMMIPKFITVPGVKKSKKKGIGRRQLMVSSRHVLLSGCMDDQTSADAYFEGKPHGALTYAFTKHLEKNRQVNWTNMHAQIVPWLKNNGFHQTPQLSGPPDLLNQVVFS